MYLSSLLNRSVEDSLIIYLELIPTQLYFAGFTLYHRDISMLMLILNSSKKSFSICFWKQLMRKLLTVSQIVSIAGYVYHKSKGLQKKNFFQLIWMILDARYRQRAHDFWNNCFAFICSDFLQAVIQVSHSSYHNYYQLYRLSFRNFQKNYNFISSFKICIVFAFVLKFAICMKLCTKIWKRK